MTFCELVGIWREVLDLDGEDAYHTVLSDDRPESGITIFPVSAALAETAEGGLFIARAYGGMNIVVTPHGASSLGGLCLRPLDESELYPQP